VKRGGVGKRRGKLTAVSQPSNAEGGCSVTPLPRTHEIAAEEAVRRNPSAGRTSRTRERTHYRDPRTGAAAPRRSDSAPTPGLVNPGLVARNRNRRFQRRRQVRHPGADMRAIDCVRQFGKVACGSGRKKIWAANREITMRKIAFTLAILSTTLVPALYTAPAHAQATRTWVSGVGDDANPCSRTAPCKTFAGAISKTANGGEINCLDPGGFGAVTITKAISIICGESGEAGVLVSGTPGITVAAGPADKVILEGLDIYGLGTGTNGVNFVSGLFLYINKCKISYFANTGVNVNSNTANATAIINRSDILFNGTSGNTATGGVAVQGNGVGNTVFILDDLVQGNQNFGVQVTGAANKAAFVRTIVSPTGIVSVNGGALISGGPSNLFGSGAPTQAVIPFQ
jgi:hypothetical protein